MVPSRVLQRIGRRLSEAQELGSYHLLEPLGTGGMGEVWRARHRLLARDAAIKLVRPELLGASTEAESKAVLRRFEREAQATAMLSSPHTIQVFDFGATEDGAFYYVMELLTGRDLESLVREFGPLPASRAIYLLRQVAHSLADAHARGLVHRDIKPANIYVCRMGLEYDFAESAGLRPGQGETVAEHRHAVDDPAQHRARRRRQRRKRSSATPKSIGAPTCMRWVRRVFPVDRTAGLRSGHIDESFDAPPEPPPIPPSQRTELPIPRELDELVLALQKIRPCAGAGESCSAWPITAARPKAGMPGWPGGSCISGN